MTDENMELAEDAALQARQLKMEEQTQGARERALLALDVVGHALTLQQALHAADAIIMEFGLSHSTAEGRALAKNLRLTQLRCSELTLHRRSLRERLDSALYDLYEAHVALGDDEKAKEYSDALEDFRQECEDVR
jgi:hypothetical protein